MREFWRRRYNPRAERLPNSIYLGATVFSLDDFTYAARLQAENASFPASDAFSGTGTDSGNTTDQNFTGRFPDTAASAGGSGQAISDGLLTMTTVGDSTTSTNKVSNESLNIAGDFTFTADYSEMDDLPAVGKFLAANIRIETSDANIYLVERVNYGNSTYERRAYDGAYRGTASDSSTSGTMKIVRSSSTWSFYIDETLVYSGTGSTANVTKFMSEFNTNDTTGTYTFKLDNFTLVDGSGDPILLPTTPICLDTSGNSKHATQATAANQPTYNAGGGSPYLTFDGTNDYLAQATFVQAQTFTAYMVANVTADTVAQTLFGDTNAYIQFNASEQLTAYAGSTVTNAVDRSGAKKLFAVEFSNTTGKLYVDGLLVESGTLGAGALAAFGIGADSAGSNPTAMDFYCLFIQAEAYNPNLSDTIATAYGI